MVLFDGGQSDLVESWIQIDWGINPIPTLPFTNCMTLSNIFIAHPPHLLQKELVMSLLGFWEVSGYRALCDITEIASLKDFERLTL